MSFVIGFGKTETDFERQEIDAFQKYTKDRYRMEDGHYTTSDVAKDVSDWVEKRAKQYRDIADEFKSAADFPPRYSCYWPHITTSASAIVCIFKFHHINRRHAMSPDGWALLQTTVLSHVFGYEVDD